MKAMVLTGIRQMELVDVPKPSIKKKNEVLVKMEAVGVCGSDVHYYEAGKIGSNVVQYPYKVGHECSGTVVEVGSDVTGVKAGQRVAVDPAGSCHNCDQCKMGRENTCRNLTFLGTPGEADGCLCEYIVMAEDSLYPIDGKITLEQAVLCEPLSIGVYAVKQAGVSQGAKVAILGAGPIGLSILLAAGAKDAGACYVTDKIEPRCKASADAGAHCVGNPDKENVVEKILKAAPAGVDVVFECAGQQETLDQAVELLRPGGKLVIVGIPRIEKVSFSIDKIRRKEITIINIRRQNNCVVEAIDLVASGRVDVDFMITHTFDFEKSKDAFELVAGYHDGVIKAMIVL